MHIILYAHDGSVGKHIGLQGFLENEQRRQVTCGDAMLTVIRVNCPRITLDLNYFVVNSDRSMFLVLGYHICFGQIESISIRNGENMLFEMTPESMNDFSLEANLRRGWYRVTLNPCVLVAKCRVNGVSKLLKIFTEPCPREVQALCDRLNHSCQECI